MAADQDLTALDTGADAATRHGLEALGFDEGEPPLLRSSNDGLAQGVLARPLCRGGEPQELFLVRPVPDDKVSERGQAAGEGASHIQYDRVELVGALEGL